MPPMWHADSTSAPASPSPRPAGHTVGGDLRRPTEPSPGVRRDTELVPLPAIHAGFWPAITRRQSPPSPLPRQPSLAAGERGLWLGAGDQEARQHYWTGH